MKHFVITYILVLSVMGCWAQKSLYNEVVLNMGPVQITKYEFEKNFNRFFSKSLGGNIQTQTKEWIDFYINQTYFLADAYQNGYIDDPRVKNDVYRVGKYMLTQPYGLFEAKTLFSNIKVTEQEIFREYEKRSKYLVSFFFFKSLIDMNKLLSGQIPNNKEEFNRAIEIHAELRPDNLFEDSLLCPCQFNEKRIGLDTLQVNQVSRPFVTPDGVYLFLVKKKGDIPEKYNETEKKKIAEYLTTKKKDSIRKVHHEKLLKTLSIATDSSLVKEMVNRLLKDGHYYQNGYAIDKLLFQDINGKNLFEYSDEEKVKKVTIEEFINYFNQCVVRSPLTEQSTIFSYIENFPLEEIYYREAVALGMTSETKYLMDEKSYRNNVINYYYDKDNFLDSIKILENELKDYYHNNITQFRDTDAINIAAFYFNSLENAEKAINVIKHVKDLNEYYLVKKDSGLIEYNLKEDFNNLDKIFKHRISFLLKRLAIDEFSKPIDIKDRFLVIKKYIEPGIRTYSFDEVKAEIKEKLHQKKLEEMKAQRLSQLKQKFQLKSTIDYNQYL